MRRTTAVLFSVLLSGCAAGPPGLAYPGNGLVLYTREAPSTARAVSLEAQEFLEALGDYLHLRAPPGTLLRIYHYPHRWDLWWHLSREVPSLQWRRGACYETDQAYVISLYGDPEKKRFRETLRHELTHYLLAAHFCDLPPWIDEGVSQVMSCGPPFPHLDEGLLKEVEQDTGKSRVQGCMKLLLVPPGEKLSPSQYHIACALTYYLLTRRPGAGPSDLTRFLGATGPGVPPQEAFSSSWGISMDEACRAAMAWPHETTRREAD